MSFTRDLSKTAVLIICDGVWLYFSLALFAFLQGGTAIWPSPLLWSAAPVAAVLLSISGRHLPPKLLFVLHLLVLGAIVTPAWTLWYTERWGWTFVLSAALSYLYIRASIHTASPPTRLQILLRFEGTIAFYLILVLVNESQHMFPFFFHVLFAFILLLSLFGMALTLYETTEDDGSEVLTKSSGTSGSFSIILGTLAAGVGLLSLLLFLPGVHTAFTSAVTAALNGALWAGTKIYYGVLWIINLFPASEVEETAPPPSSGIDPPEVGGSPDHGTLPISWIITAGTILIVLLALWLTSRLLQKRPRSMNVRTRRTRFPGESFWKLLWQLLARMWKKWQRRSPDFYAARVYWEFHQFSRWAQQQGIRRQAQETPLEFTTRAAAALPLDEEAAKSLYELGRTYSTVYYSEQNTAPDYNIAPLKTFMKNYS